MSVKNIITFSFLIIALSIAYYFVIFLPNKEKARQEQEIFASIEKKSQFKSCMDKAEDSYTATWNLRCKQSNQKDGCTLSKYQYEDVDIDYYKERELCIKEYK